MSYVFVSSKYYFKTNVMLHIMSSWSFLHRVRAFRRNVMWFESTSIHCVATMDKLLTHNCL